MFKWLVSTRVIGRSADLTDVDIEIRWRLSRWWGLFIVPFLSGHIFYPERPPHPRYTTLKSALNKKDSEILKKIDELKKLLAERDAVLDWVNSELDYEREQLGTFGIGAPKWMTAKQLKSWLKPYHGKPDTSEYERFFHQEIQRKHQLHSQSHRRGHQQGGANRRAGPGAGGPIVPGRGEVSAYTLEEFANKSLHIAEDTGARQVLGFRENQDKNKGDQKARMDKLRQDYPRREGESNNDWNNRLQKIMREQQ